MGKKKRGKRNSVSNTAYHIIVGHDGEQFDTILNITSDEAECVEPLFHIEECKSQKEELLTEVSPTATTTSLKP